MLFDLCAEFVGVGERAQRVGVCCGEEFHFAGVGEFTEDVDEFGHVLFELFECDAGYGDSAAEFAFGFFDHTQQGLGCGDVALVGDAANDVFVEEEVVVVVVVADIEETVAFEAERLVDFEYEVNCFHSS